MPEEVEMQRRTSTPMKKPRKKSKYATAYGKNFKKIAGKYKNKKGSWKKDGFKRAQKEAHRMTKREMK